MKERLKGGFEEPPLLLREELVQDRIDVQNISRRLGGTLRAINMIDAANAIWKMNHERQMFIWPKIAALNAGRIYMDASDRFDARVSAAGEVNENEADAISALVEYMNAFEDQGITSSAARLLAVVGVDYTRGQSEREGVLTVNPSPERDENRVAFIRGALEELHEASYQDSASVISPFRQTSSGEERQQDL